jgi:hypothetical protein
MSEKIPQSNPENIDVRKYLIPMPGDTYVYGVINEDRLALRVSKQRNGPDLQVRMVEVIYETVGEDGEPVIERKMISDHILSDDVQQHYLDSINRKKGI